MMIVNSHRFSQFLEKEKFHVSKSAIDSYFYINLSEKACKIGLTDFDVDSSPTDGSSLNEFRMGSPKGSLIELMEKPNMRSHSFYGVCEVAVQTTEEDFQSLNRIGKKSNYYFYNIGTRSEKVKDKTTQEKSTHSSKKKMIKYES